MRADTASQAFDDPLAGAQADPVAGEAFGIAHPAKQTEQLVGLWRLKTHAVIANLNSASAIAFDGADLDPSRAIGKLERVGQQVLEHRDQQGKVCVQGWQRRQPNVCLGQRVRALKVSDGLGNGLVEIDLLQVE